MQNSDEQKTNIFQRFINSTIKFTKDLTHELRSKSPDEKFKYELPDSFLQAVDKARLDAGYDILPRHRARSSSSSSSDNASSLNLTKSSSADNLPRISTRKIAFRRSRPQIRPPNVQPRLFSPRPRFPIVMNPNAMIINRPHHRPVNIMQPRMFRMRFC